MRWRVEKGDVLVWTPLQGDKTVGMVLREVRNEDIEAKLLRKLVEGIYNEYQKVKD